MPESTASACCDDNDKRTSCCEPAAAAEPLDLTEIRAKEPESNGSALPDAGSADTCGPPPSSSSASEPCCPPRPEPSESSCCTPGSATRADEPCCGSGAEAVIPRWADRERPGYHLWPFVEGWIETPVGEVPRVKTTLDHSDVLGRWAMRWGLGRDRYRIAPGLYAVGQPTPDSPVLVTANYKMTFDVLRRDLAGEDAWLVVLETNGINVWCAAGKGTFATDELVTRVAAIGLDRVVTHRKLVVPQLGAVGVAAHEVKKRCGFAVTYGPIRSKDVPGFLAAGMKATPEMRDVTFTTLERLVLTPVELRVILLKPSLWLGLALLILGGVGPAVFSFSAAYHRGLAAIGVAFVGVLSGAVVTPTLLPWLPGKAFSAKGAAVGAATGLLLAVWMAPGLVGGLAVLLAVTSASSFCAMNFTGATPFTSPSGVEAEMRKALPWQVGAATVAGLCWIAGAWFG